MITVKEIVGDGQKPLHTIGAEATVQAAIMIMSSKKISALPVVEDKKLIGIISERDYVRKIASKKIPAWSVKIHEIMTKDVITIDINSSIEECMELMNTKRIRHLPVMEGDDLKTLISITDVISVLSPDKN